MDSAEQKSDHGTTKTNQQNRADKRDLWVAGFELIMSASRDLA